MAQEDVERRLTTILAADVVGYSRLMEADEEATARTLRAYREIIDGLVADHRGRVFGSAGDSVVAEFPSPVEAVRCAVDIQRELEAHNVDLAEDRRMRLRIGINLGDVIVEGDNLIGDGVNIAARLETLADAGGICLSRPVFDQIKKRLDLDYEYLGEHEVKNITEPIRVYRVAGGPKSNAATQISEPAAKPWVSPSSATVGETPTTGAARRDVFGKPGIVILPFENLSGAPEQEYFCHGLTHDITTDLSKFANLFVIAAASAFHYADKRSTPQAVARELGVRYLLEGSVQKSGNTIRVNAQLIDATTAGHLWAERFHRDFEDLFALQDEIIHMIVASLSVKVTAVERERAARKKTDDVNAYDAYQKGAHVYLAQLDHSHETDEGLKESRMWLEKAIELDPNYARAWGWLAYTSVNGWLEGWGDEQSLEKAEEFAKKAVALDPDDYDTHWALAFVFSHTGRPDQALSEYNDAFDLNPNDPNMLVEMSETLLYIGEHQKCIDQIKHAMVINPHFPEWYRWDLGWAYHHAKEYQKSNLELNKIVRPNNEVRLIMAANYGQIASAYTRNNEPSLAAMATEQAAMAMNRFLEKRPDWIVEKERKKVSFKNPEDEEHWINGIRMAGLPER